nr:unnamed protein product [Callosobruchus analis]
MAILGATIELYRTQSEENRLYLILTLVMGVFNIIVGTIMVAALIKGKERLVFLYMVLELTNLMIITIFALINTFRQGYYHLSIVLFICFFLWYGLWCTWSFYAELAEYNSVKSGPTEIVYQQNINPVAFPDRAMESTHV